MDNVQAHLWFSLTADEGNAETVRYLDSAAKLMTPDQIAKAEQLASNWRAAQPALKSLSCRVNLGYRWNENDLSHMFFRQKLFLCSNNVTQRVLLCNNWLDFTAFDVTNKIEENLGVL